MILDLYRNVSLRNITARPNCSHFIGGDHKQMNRKSADVPVLVAGGGIGGLAAALALTRQGFAVKVLEQAPQLGEIGAGIQLGPNGFAAFDALGLGEKARARAVYADEMVMYDALGHAAGCGLINPRPSEW